MAVGFTNLVRYAVREATNEALAAGYHSRPFCAAPGWVIGVEAQGRFTRLLRERRPQVGAEEALGAPYGKFSNWKGRR